MNRNLMKLFGVIFFVVTMFGCSTPADYNDKVNYTMNKAVQTMKNIDNIVSESKDTISSVDLELLQNVKNELMEIEAYNGDSSLVVSSRDLLDFYVISSGYYNQVLMLNDTTGVQLKEYISQREIFAQKCRLEVMKQHNEFAKRYELMHGMVVAE